MNNPCINCLVKACCKMRLKTVWYKCGCDSYELYRIWNCLSILCYDNTKMTQLMMRNDERVKQINKNK